ncbi:hypothetical protein [Rhodococcus jostii]|uniref:hypothetical protein n=1 Tax=Rhodococcus jostii TaxID=132919 RepID=UPI003644D809
MTTHTMNRGRLRQLGYTPLIVALAAAALCTTAGTSAEAATTPAPTDVFQYDWTLANHTGRPIYGTWNITVTAGNNSHVAAPAHRPWQPGDTATDTQFQHASDTTNWSGHICYDEHWWGFAHSQNFGYLSIFDIPAFSLEADSRGALFVYPFPSDRAVRMALIPENGVCK